MQRGQQAFALAFLLAFKAGQHEREERLVAEQALCLRAAFLALLFPAPAAAFQHLRGDLQHTTLDGARQFGDERRDQPDRALLLHSVRPANNTCLLESASFGHVFTNDLFKHL